MPTAPRAPSADPLVALADQCVQCGLCLPACPTYRREGMEPESPRGRIALARAWALETIPPTAAGDAHLDHCLACRACEAVCPAGVRFGELLVLARGRQRARRRPGAIQRLLEWLAARPWRLDAALAVYRAIAPAWPLRWRPVAPPPRLHPGDPLRTGGGSLPRTSAHRDHEAPEPASRPSDGPSRHRLVPEDSPSAPAGRPVVALFVGCAARSYESPARAAVARLLAAAGVDVVVPDGQSCCGSLHAHAGDAAAASALATRNATAFAGHATILTLASGCHEAVSGGLPAGSRAVDALALLADRIDTLAFRPSGERVALHLPCTQRNVVGSAPALRRLIAAVPQTTVIPLDAGAGCCGASGTQFLGDPARAAGYRQPLLEQLHASGARRLLSANIGCRLHLQNGTTVPVEHPLDFLARHLSDTSGERAPTLDSAA